MEVVNSLNLLNYAPKHQPQDKGVDGYSMAKLQRTAGHIPSYDSFWSLSSAKTEIMPQDKAFEKLVKEQINPQDNSYNLTMDDSKIEKGMARESADRFNLFDFLDMINPLQHIPVVNYIYRHMTGDEIKPISAIIGGAVFAGPAGAASGLVSSVVEHGTGSSLPEAVLSMASGERKTGRFSAYEKVSALDDAPFVNGVNYDYNS